MHIVDSHCHVSPVWFEPVETLLFQMDRHSVAQAVLTQLLGQFDNTYQQHCVIRYPGRFARIVAVDPAAAAACGQLQRLATEGATGVRLRPQIRSPGADPYNIWRTAAQCRLAVSCAGTAASFLSPAFAELVQALPDLMIVLEHLGGLARPDCDGGDDTRTGIGALARFPNLLLKVPEKEALDYRDYCLRERGDPGAMDGLPAEVLPSPKTTPPEVMKQIRFKTMAGFGGVHLVGTPEQIVEKLQQFSAAGADSIVLSWVNYQEGLRTWRRDVLPLMEQSGLRQPYR